MSDQVSGLPEPVRAFLDQGGEQLVLATWAMPALPDAVVLPEPTSPILTRELLYTAVTRAQRQVIVVGSEDSVRLAVGRPIARATGLGERLWGPENLR